jgi:site-specific DNA recombinase
MVQVAKAGGEPAMRAVAYVRVSDKEQLDGWSMPGQRHEFERYCEQKDWQAVEVYSEEGISARSDSIGKRPQFRRLLDDCKRGRFDVVVVHSLDRWSRNVGVTLETFKQLADSRIAFVSITENIDYSSPEGKLSITMLGAFAQYFSDSLAKHTSKGMKERAMTGFQNGDVPFGYRRCNDDCHDEHKGRVHLVAAEADAVKQMFRLYARGDWSLSSIASWLNGQGFRTRNNRRLDDGYGGLTAGPRPFTLFSVRWILHNPFYTGRVRYKGELYEGAQEAIIDQDLYESVQKKMRNAKNRSSTFSPRSRVYLLKGIARCVICGYPLWSETSVPGYAYYREQKNARADFSCLANGKAIRCDVIDEQMDSVIQSLALVPSWRERIAAKMSVFSDRDRIVQQRKQITERLRRLGKAYVDGVMGDGEYGVQRTLLNDALNSLVLPEAHATIAAGELLENLGPVWREATLEEKHRLLTVMLEAVYVDLAASRSIVGLQPKAPFYPLFDSLKQMPGNKVIIFRPGEVQERKTGSVLNAEPDFGLVETGESRTPRPKELAQDLLQA